MILLIQFFLVLLDLRQETGLLGVSLGLLSVGLGFIAIGISAKYDRKYTNLLERLDKGVERLPTLFKSDFLTITGQHLAEEILAKEGRRRYADVGTLFVLTTEEQSKEAAQKRLDEDTQKVGHVRGEIYRLEDGSWGIHWGGKYPLCPCFPLRGFRCFDSI